MNAATVKWLQHQYLRIVSSIAFYTVITALGFLVLSWVMLMVDTSAWGTSVKAQWNWLRLRDASTARTIASTIAGGLISVTVFSFSMVMIILNQAASQLSNRTLNTMIGNRFQQIVLGFYIGTIAYSLFLLSSIRDIDSGIHVPALSVYLLILLAVTDLFLFIYFLHYVTETVKYSTVIKRIHHQTKKTLELLNQSAGKKTKALPEEKLIVSCRSSGYYQGYHQKNLISWAKNNNTAIEFLYPAGSYLLKNTSFLIVYGRELTEDDCEALWEMIDFYNGQSPANHYYYGFLHLTEIAVKALSPGVNDPSTAVLSLHALSDLFSLLKHNQPTALYDEQGVLRILKKEWQFEELYQKCIVPIWHYGKKDPFIKDAMAHLIQQLSELNIKPSYKSLFADIETELKPATKNRML